MNNSSEIQNNNLEELLQSIIKYMTESSNGPDILVPLEEEGNSFLFSILRLYRKRKSGA